jgi:glycosyltransferase involved in cell wall biosynthesis
MISLIISVFNRTEQLRKNLLRFKYLTLPDEIVIVDDGTHIKNEVPNMLKTLDFLKGKIKYIRHENPDWDSCSIPKNIGLKNATGDILIYSEPENIFMGDIVEKAKTLPRNKFFFQDWIYFGKNTSPPFPEDRLDDPLAYLNEYGWHKWQSGTVDVHGGLPTYTKAVMVSPWYIVIRKKDLMAIGGWDEMMSKKNGGGAWGFDDIDLITRLRESRIMAMTIPISVIHQWHDRPPQAIQDSWGPNEEIMNSKKKEDTGDYKEEFIVANKGRGWGQYDGFTEEI